MATPNAFGHNKSQLKANNNKRFHMPYSRKLERFRMLSFAALCVLAFASISAPWQASAAMQAEPTSTRPLALTDIMKFREIERQVWNDTGTVYAYDAVP